MPYNKPTGVSGLKENWQFYDDTAWIIEAGQTDTIFTKNGATVTSAALTTTAEANVDADIDECLIFNEPADAIGETGPLQGSAGTLFFVAKIEGGTRGDGNTAAQFTAYNSGGERFDLTLYSGLRFELKFRGGAGTTLTIQSDSFSDQAALDGFRCFAISWAVVDNAGTFETSIRTAINGVVSSLSSGSTGGIPGTLNAGLMTSSNHTFKLSAMGAINRALTEAELQTLTVSPMDSLEGDPVFGVVSVSDSNPAPGDSVVVNFENAAPPFTATLEGQAISIASQDATSATITWPDARTFGNRSLTFDSVQQLEFTDSSAATALTIVESQAPGYQVTISNPVNEDYSLVWDEEFPAANGDLYHAEWISGGNGITDFPASGDTTKMNLPVGDHIVRVYIYQDYGDLYSTWSEPADITISGGSQGLSLDAVNVNADGDQVGLVFSEPVTYSAATLALSMSLGAANGTYDSGSGTDTLVFLLDRVLKQTETGTAALTVSAGGIQAVDDSEDVESVGSINVDNGSTVPLVTPVFTVQPEDQSEAHGDLATFSAAVTDADSLQWTENGVDIPGATASTYQVTADIAGNNGNVYRLRATSPDQVVVFSDQATLSVAATGMKVPAPLELTEFYNAGVTYSGLPRLTPTKPAQPAAIQSPNQRRMPFVKEPMATLRSAAQAAGRWIILHYFGTFPLMINNEEPLEEYYHTQLTAPGGEGGIHLPKGGFLRQTRGGLAPIPELTADVPESYRVTNLREELFTMMQIGANVIAPDLLGESGDHINAAHQIAELTSNEDLLDFLITIDLRSSYINGNSNRVQDVAAVIDSFASYSSALISSDTGRLVVSFYGAEDGDWSYADFTALIAEMSGTHGIEIDILPIYQPVASHMLALFNELNANGYAARLIGGGDWVRGYRSGAADRVAEISVFQDTTTYGKQMDYLFPFGVQVHRPKSPWYQGAQNLDTLTEYGYGLVAEGPKHVNLVTYNDKSEGTEIAPATGTGFVPFDISAFFIQWSLMGSQPAIVDDTLMFFYRKQLTGVTAASIAGGDLYDAIQTIPFGQDAGIFDDYIQLFAFLKAPAVLEVEHNGRRYNKPVGAGIQSLKIESAVGPAPVFRIRRGNVIVEEIQGRDAIADKYYVQDMLYRGGSSRRLQPLEPTANSLFPSSRWKFGNYMSSGIDATLMPIDDDVRSPFPRKTEKPAVRYTAIDQSVATGLGFSFLPVPETDDFEVTFDFSITEIGGANGMRMVFELYGDDRAAPAHIFYCDIDAGQTSGTFGYITPGVDNAVGNIEADTWYRAVIRVKGSEGGVLDVALYEAGTLIDMALVGEAVDISPRYVQSAALHEFTLRGSTNPVGSVDFDNLHAERVA